MSKTIIIELSFADANLWASDFMEDISNAIEYCMIGQAYRNKVKLDKITYTKTKLGSVCFVIEVLEKYVSSYLNNTGSNLRAISDYLLKKSRNKDLFSEHKIGTRLLVYKAAVLDCS